MNGPFTTIKVFKNGKCTIFHDGEFEMDENGVVNIYDHVKTLYPDKYDKLVIINDSKENDEVQIQMF